MPTNQGLVAAPGSVAVGSNPTQLFGKQADALGSELHGKYYTAAYNGRLFTASAAAVTIPVIASSLVSVFTLWNPPGSGINMELAETSVSVVLASTVVDTVGWYYSTAAQTANGTFTTAGTPQNALVGGPVGQGKFFSAYTHNGTPVLVDVIGNFGAITEAGSAGPTKLYDGKLILPPGIAMSIAMSTAASNASGLTAFASWSEWPI
jgi:hypothetical protein